MSEKGQSRPSHSAPMVTNVRYDPNSDHSRYECECPLSATSDRRTAANSILFDHLVGGGEQCWRHGEAEHPGGLGVDDQLELSRLQDRQVRGLDGIEDATGVDAGLTPRIRNISSVTHQPTGFGSVTRRIYRGDRVVRRQKSQLDAAAVQERIVADEKGVRLLAHKSCESRINIAAGA